SLKYIPAARASTIALLEPVTGTIFALIFLGEIPPITTWIGIVIALLGISIASLSHLRGGLRQT
ncbi:MAG: EamA family transporter, partial [Chloroflexi bacterium]|nr:EamA family transporter [Chloroflexota bacterium]